MAYDLPDQDNPLKTVKPKTVGALSSLNTVTDPKPLPDAAAPKTNGDSSSAVLDTVGSAAKGVGNFSRNLINTVGGTVEGLAGKVADPVINASARALGVDPNTRNGGPNAISNYGFDTASQGAKGLVDPLVQSAGALRNAAQKGFIGAFGGKPLPPAPASAPIDATKPAVSPAAAGAPASQPKAATPAAQLPVTQDNAKPDGTIYASADRRSFSDTPIKGGAEFDPFDPKNMAKPQGDGLSADPRERAVQVALGAQSNQPTIGSVAGASQQSLGAPVVIPGLDASAGAPSQSTAPVDQGLEIGRQPSQEEQVRQEQIRNIQNAIAHNRGGITGLANLTTALDRLLGNNVDLKDQNVQSEINSRKRAADTNDFEARTRDRVANSSIGETAAQTRKLNTENQAGQIGIADAVRLNQAAEAYRQNPTDQNAQILRSLQGKERQPRFLISESRSVDPATGLSVSTPYVLNNESGEGHFAERTPSKADAIPATFEAALPALKAANPRMSDAQLKTQYDRLKSGG